MCLCLCGRLLSIPKPTTNPALFPCLLIRDNRLFIISRPRRVSSPSPTRFLCSLSPSSIRPSVHRSHASSKFVLQVAPLLLLLCKLGRRSARTNRRYFTPVQCVSMSVISPLFFIILIFHFFWREKVLLVSVPMGARSPVSVFEVLEGSSLLAALWHPGKWRPVPGNN